MPVNKEAYQTIKAALDAQQVTLVAVSKTKPVEDILALYELGQRDFGENYVQELLAKAAQLPGDIRWHFIGHLQRNKVKSILPVVYMVHGVDSERLLAEISAQAIKADRTVNCLLQVHVAAEETKFGLDENELHQLITTLQRQPAAGLHIQGLMGMASFTSDMQRVRDEFRKLKTLFSRYAGIPMNGLHFNTLSMGMSSDYAIAVEEGSTMVRIGSLLFGEREKIKE